MARSILILGAGVCGLAAALKALELDPGARVTLLEADDKPGGLARCLTIRGQHADLGPHRIHTELPDVKAFLADIAGTEMQRVARRSRMWLRGQWIEYPPKPLEVLRALGAATAMRAGLSPLVESARRLMRPAGGPENFETVMAGAFGSELYRLIVMDYTRKVWKTPPSRLHADIARVRVSAGGFRQLVKRVLVPEKEGEETALKQFFYLPGGAERLVQLLRARVEAAGGKVVTERSVESIEPIDGGRWRVVSRGPRGGARRDTANAVISTIPLPLLLDSLLALRPDKEVARSREGLVYLANFLVGVVVKKRRVTDCQWLYFPGKDTVFNRAYEPRNFSESMGEGDETLLVAEVTCRPGDKIHGASDAALVARVKQGLARTGLVREADIVDAFVHRIPWVYPLYDLEYSERLQPVWKYLSHFPGLVSTGRQGLFLHNNMDHSIHMGFEAARCAVEKGAADAPRAFYRNVRRYQQFRIVD